jgi:D-serine deaminase-like pyridoxal phosphate-dependent protein
VGAKQDLIGQSKWVLDTPALLVDLDLMEANIARIVATCRAHGVAWRPHAKSQKSPDIAHKLLAAGAIGLTCAKLGEVEVFADAGIRDCVIANQIVGPCKARRLMALLDRANPVVSVDSIPNLDELNAAAVEAGKTLKVVIEVNVGMNRAGVEPGAPVLALAREIAARQGLHFAGLLAWESHATRIADPDQKARVVAEAIAKLTASARLCREAGYDVEIVSCGGTGTFPYCAQQPGVTEIQTGGAIFGDMHYLTNYHSDFATALTILATVTSRPTATRIITDAGNKAMSTDLAMPKPLGLPDLKVLKISAEHSLMELAAPSEEPRIGGKIEFIAGYSDSTVYRHEEIVAVRKDQIEAIWPIAARGKLK